MLDTFLAWITTIGLLFMINSSLTRKSNFNWKLQRPLKFWFKDNWKPEAKMERHAEVKSSFKACKIVYTQFVKWVETQIHSRIKKLRWTFRSWEHLFNLSCLVKKWNPSERVVLSFRAWVKKFAWDEDPFTLVRFTYTGLWAKNSSIIYDGTSSN